jgi:hypothetical protein
LIEASGDQTVGVFDVTANNISSPSETQQQFRYDEKNLAISLNQQIGSLLTLGMRYRVTESELDVRYPAIPTTVTPAAHTDERAVLQQMTLSALFNHPSGFFGSFESLWSRQSNEDLAGSLPREDFWQFNARLGYRFSQRRIQVAAGILNLTDQDYELNPLNFYAELPRARTFTASLKFEF